MNNVLEYLEKSARKYPHKTAVIDENCSCTYEELMEDTVTIGNNLREIDRLCTKNYDYIEQCNSSRSFGFDEQHSLGTNKEENCNKQKHSPAVVVFMDKSVKTLKAFMGIVYYGGFYSLVDPSFPISRIQQIFDILGPCCVITNAKNRNILNEIDYNGCICDIDELLVKNEGTCSYDMGNDISSNMRNAISANIGNNMNGNNLRPLYCNFTSGSTGVPKGVLISHKSVISFIDNFVDTFGIDSNDVIGNQAPFDFDVSVKDIYSCLKTGATLVIIPKSYFMFPNKVMDMLDKYKVTTLIWAVSALVMINRLKGLMYKTPSSINKIMFSGEVMPIKQLNKWREYYPKAMFVNLYGPTEITCNCTYYIVDRYYNEYGGLPLGRPFAHNKVYLFDKNNNVILKNMVDKKGEICVCGDGLAIEYINNKSATDKAFVTMSINGENVRLYKTGDLASYGADGYMYYEGRKDFQIKHMGHRIELEEIENVLGNVPVVEQACCFFDEDKNKIVAYIVGIDNKREIIEHMKRRVPEYMVPNIFRHVDRMPLNKNGKTDRKLLKTLYKEGCNKN
ncbi:MAG: amino acid adenylation domain-containing protein [Lachnospiraceae bacterium]|nr:amino acid adenylation domain-containing protein [Lachnospiraceae bacterium]